MTLFKNKKRRIYYYVLSILVALFLWIYWSNVTIQVNHITINCDKIPDSFHGFKIVQVSDLHNAEFGDNQSTLLNAINDVSPDVIAVTGDLIDSNHTDIKIAMEFIKGAVKIAPVYYVAGNHEAWTDKYPELVEQLEESGVHILNDKSVNIERSGESIKLIGVNDPDFMLDNDLLEESTATLNEKLKSLSNEDNLYTVLLSHRPELFDSYINNHVDLVLSGHAHGGQFRLPIIGGLISPNQGFLPQFTEGLYEAEQTKMIVSRGLGNSIIPVRINNRPELVVITFD